MDRDPHDSEYNPYCCSGRASPWMDGLSPFTSQMSVSSHRMGAVREWGEE